MDSQTHTQAIVVAQSTLDSNQDTEEIALFDTNGDPYVVTATGADFTTLQSRVTALESIPAVTTATAIGTAGKTTASAEPAANRIVPVKFTNGNSASSPTVSFNGGAARSILLGGSAPTGAKMTVAAGGVVLFWFDGTSLHQFGTVA